MRALIEDATAINEKLKAYSVLNAADATGKDNEDAAAVLRQCAGIHYLDCPIVRRKAFPNAAAQGKGVGEYAPRDQKAIDELATLMAFIYQNDH
jgi:chromosome partitioning protein